MKGILSQLPPPPENKSGWPWDVEADPSVYSSKKNLPAISIVTPSFNQGEYLEKTIRSVLLQNYPNLEYIVVDGGSKDGSVEIIKKYSGWLKFWCSEEDKGQTEAINKGLDHCSGEVFNWLNSDDYYSSECFEVISENFESGKTQILAGKYRMFFEVGNREDKIKEFNVQPLLEETIASVLINQPSCFFSLQSLREIGKLNTHLDFVMDQDIWIRFLLKHGQHNIKIVNKLLAHFRVHKNSKSFKFEFDKEQMMIFSSIARKCGMNSHADLICEAYGIVDMKEYEILFNFDNTSSELARKVVNSVTYQLLRKAFRDGDTELFNKCKDVTESNYLSPSQKSGLKKLKLKSTLSKFGIID